jgi:lipid-binding SYLF domain-containing protein
MLPLPLRATTGYGSRTNSTRGFHIMITAIRAAVTCIVLALSSHVAIADEYTDAITVFRNAGESGAYFEKSVGYAVFPTIGKAGIGVGGAYGKGKVYKGGKVIGNTSMAKASIGLQLGGQAYTQIIFFENEDALKNFTSGNFEFGAEASAVAITAGASASANTGGGTSAGVSGGQNDASTTSLGYRKGMAVFTVAKGGLMYEVSLGGQKYSYEPIGE